MTDDTQFDVDADESFYITIADGATVYESLDAAVDEVGDKLETDDDAFVAETSINDNGSGDDVSIELNQVKWQKIIPKMNDG
jgi:hypothetical protein